MQASLAEDYFDFFDNRAFTDDSPMYPCYCNAFQMTEEQIQAEIIEMGKANGGGKEGLRLAIRESAERMVRQNVMQGYLAYDGDMVIGWCNANDKKNYSPSRLANGHDGNEEGVKVKSVVCFEIAPAYRDIWIMQKALR